MDDAILSTGYVWFIHNSSKELPFPVSVQWHVQAAVLWEKYQLFPLLDVSCGIDAAISPANLMKQVQAGMDVASPVF
jgi:hypothetical protein